MTSGSISPYFSQPINLHACHNNKNQRRFYMFDFDTTKNFLKAAYNTQECNYNGFFFDKF